MLGRILLALQMILLVTTVDAQDESAKQASHWVRKTGLVTSRLSTREFVKWREIERIVFAEDEDLQPLHPTLRNLWQWIETSGHTVYVEIIQLRGPATCTAGHFQIERFDPVGEHHIAVIKLNISSINQAYVGARTKRNNGFIPFLGLDKQERYAEVLGHELAHAIHILTSLERARRVEEVIQQTNATLLFQLRQGRGRLADDLIRRLAGRDDLLGELEEQAEDMERIVWEELTAHKSTGNKSFYLADKP